RQRPYRQMSTAKPAARDIVRRCRKRSRHAGMAREIRAAKAHAVERRVVLISTEAKHRETVWIAVLTWYELHTGKRRRHCREIAEIGRRQRGVRHRTLGTTDVRLGVIAGDLLTRRGDLHGLETHCRTREFCVGDKNFLISGALDLEALHREAQRGERDDVVA